MPLNHGRSVVISGMPRPGQRAQVVEGAARGEPAGIWSGGTSTTWPSCQTISGLPSTRASRWAASAALASAASIAAPSSNSALISGRSGTTRLPLGGGCEQLVLEVADPADAEPPQHQVGHHQRDAAATYGS